VSGSAFALNSAKAEASLLRWLGVKRDLLCLQISNQLLGPVNGDRIAYREPYALIPHNRFVDFHALLTHCHPRPFSEGAALIGRLNAKTV
jgi:hypothetical protein